jgi:hypothetical protein
LSFSTSSSASPLSLTYQSNDNRATIPQQTSNENEDLTLRTLKFTDYITPPKNELEDLIFKAHLLKKKWYIECNPDTIGFFLFISVGQTVLELSNVS